MEQTTTPTNAPSSGLADAIAFTLCCWFLASEAARPPPLYGPVVYASEPRRVRYWKRPGYWGRVYPREVVYLQSADDLGPKPLTMYAEPPERTERTEAQAENLPPLQLLGERLRDHI